MEHWHVFNISLLIFVMYISKLYGQQQTCDCGLSMGMKIISGQETGVNEYPCLVALVKIFTSLPICGGAIIAQRYLLSAGSCVRGLNIGNIVAVVGDHDLRDGSDSSFATQYLLDRYIIHPNYSENTGKNNIAVLRTQTNIVYTRGVSPICLPPPLNALDTFANDIVTIVGWGPTSFPGSNSNTPQKINVRVIDNSDCQKTYPNTDDTQLCTFDYTGTGRSTCQSDAGGPVIFNNGRQYLVGLSSEQSCGTKNTDVNTRITSFLTWIYKHTNYTTCTVSFDGKSIISLLNEAFVNITLNL